MNLMDSELSSPTLLEEISNNEIKSHIDSDAITYCNITFIQFPVHTQVVNLNVKLVTEVPGEVCGPEF